MTISNDKNDSRDIHLMTCSLYLDDLGADLVGARAELGPGAVGVLSVHHADVGTAPGGNHLWTHADRNMSRRTSN